jgi:hypothetical protein
MGILAPFLRGVCSVACGVKREVHDVERVGGTLKRDGFLMFGLVLQER